MKHMPHVQLVPGQPKIHAPIPNGRECPHCDRVTGVPFAVSTAAGTVTIHLRCECCRRQWTFQKPAVV